MSEVKSALNSKELQRKAEMKNESEGSGFFARGRNQRKNEKLAEDDQDLRPEMVEDATSVIKKGILEKTAIRGRRR